MTEPKMSMKTLARTLKAHQNFLYKQLYSTSADKRSGKINLELVDIPTEEEIEHEVIFSRLIVVEIKVQFADDEAYLHRAFVGRRSANSSALERSKLGGEVVGFQRSEADRLLAWMAGELHMTLAESLIQLERFLGQFRNLRSVDSTTSKESKFSRA